jgi:hypothetical protein
MNLKYKKHKSQYELKYLIWSGIDFDREKLIKFIKKTKLLKFYSFFLKSYQEEYKIHKLILESYDSEKIIGLLENNENISRLCLIEKWSRIGAIEIVVSGTFSKKTYETVSNLPISDYQQFTKRVQELIALSNNFTTQDYTAKTELPGT